MPRINVYIGTDTAIALARRREQLARKNQRLEVSQICEAALRVALRLKEKK